MIIYLDSDYECHLTDDGTRQPIETHYFDGKCQAYIEGYRYVPEGEVWARSDGAKFSGLMIAPWKNYTILEAVQAAYEQAQSEAITAYVEGVNTAYE